MPVIIDSVLRAGEGKTLRRLKRIADQVNSIEEDFAALSDAELRAHDRRVPAAATPTASPSTTCSPRRSPRCARRPRRTLGQRHFDVQLMGGAALHMGNIAEMRTGEGKTLTSVLPAYLNALTGEGVHVVTVNDYLAKRDSEWMGRVHHFLGLEVGRDPGPDAAGGAPQGSTRPTSPTAPTTSSASTTCATTWPGAWRSASSAGTTSPSWTRSTRSWSTRRGRR